LNILVQTDLGTDTEPLLGTAASVVITDNSKVAQVRYLHTLIAVKTYQHHRPVQPALPNLA